MSRNRWVVLLIAITAAVLVLESGDPTHASWPVLFLTLFGIAFMARALWHTVMLTTRSHHRKTKWNI